MTLPPDPFAGDPDDPSCELAALDETVRVPLVPDEREQVLTDLEDVEVFEALLDAGTVGAHEPAHAPDPDDYVSWDYARGFSDASLEG